MRIAYSNVLSQSWESALGTLAKLQFGGAEANLKLGRAVAQGYTSGDPQRSHAEDMLQRHHNILFQESILAVAEQKRWNMVEQDGGTVPLSPLWVSTQHWNLMATCSCSTGLGLRQSAELFSWVQEKKARSHVLHCNPLDALGITIGFATDLGNALGFWMFSTCR